MASAVALVSLILGGCIFFPSIFSIIRKYSASLLASDHKSAKSTSATIALRCTSIIQALLATTVGVNILKTTYQDVIYSRSMLVDVYASFGVPYMIYDVGAMYIVHREDKQLHDAPIWTTISSFIKKQFVLVAHHLVLAFVFYPFVMFLRNGKGDFLIGCFFLAELSTPAMNLRAILIKLNLGDTIFFRLNNIVFLISFFVCRILLFPFLYWVYSYNKQLSIYDTMSSMRVVCHVGCAGLLATQVMWFVKFLQVVRWKRKVCDSSPPKQVGNGLEDRNQAVQFVRNVGKAD